MYLSRHFIDNSTHYFLCESFAEGQVFRNRKLLELGADPGKYIIYPGGSSFYIDEAVLDGLQKAGVEVDYDEVESFFIPFLDPYIKVRIYPFLHRSKNRGWKRMDAEARIRVLATSHVFDRRRIHYLRFGQTDLRELDRSPSLFKVLMDKSRDEIEQLILEREQDLRPNEYKRYIFAIFDLQRFFTQSCARTMPHALDSNRLDEYFLQEICRLDADQNFWRGMKRNTGLVSYMIRYVVMFFDYSFPGGQQWNDFFKANTRAGQQSRPHKGSRRMSMREATTVFGVSQRELSTMSKTEIIRLYRKKAQQLHPDKGGDHEQFIELTAAYNELLRIKS